MPLTEEPAIIRWRSGGSHYQRESGYDSDNEDWFWAKYMPDGSLAVKSKMGMKIRLAGRVAKGKSEGCIACHHGAPGGDYVFASDITVR